MRKKIFIILLIFSVMPVMAISFLIENKGNEVIKDTLYNNSLEFVNLIEKSINEKLTHAYEDNLSWSLNKAYLNLLEDKKKDIYDSKKILKDLFGSYEEHYNYFAIIDKYGKVIALEGGSPSVKEGYLLQNETFQQSEKDKVLISELGVNEITKTHSLDFYIPIIKFSDHPEVIGFFTSSLKWEIVSNFVNSMNIRGNKQDVRNHIMLTNHAGTILSCYDNQKIFEENLIDAGLKSAKYAREGKEGIIVEKSEHNLKSFITYTPLRNIEFENFPNPGWLIVLLQDYDEAVAPLKDLRNNVVIVMGVIIAILLTGAMLTSKRITDPILHITKVADEIGKGRFEKKIEIKGQDEIAVLIKSLNDMINKLNASRLEIEEQAKEKAALEKQLYLSSKLASMGELAAGVAHEINNPLAIIVGNMEDIKDEIEDKNIKNELIDKLIQNQKKAVTRIQNVSGSLRKFARTQANEELIQLDTHTIINETVNFVQTIFSKKNINIILRLNCRHSIIEGYVGELQQLFMNLLSNAQHAMNGKKNGEIIITTEDLKDKKGIICSVSDNGCGISKDIIERIFDPFFTTKPAGEGTGLGLSILFGIVKKINGRITVESEVGKGTTFKIMLPCCREPEKCSLINSSCSEPEKSMVEV